MGIASDFVLIIVAGVVGGFLARALRLPLLIGYIAAGVLVGPHTAGPTVVQVHDIELLAEIGVALLLFSLGLELSFRDLQHVRRVALIGGPIQIVLTAFVAALFGIKAFNLPPMEAVWIGAMISVSSTIVVLKTMAEKGGTSTQAGRIMIGLLVVQDLAVVPMLIVLPHLATPDQLLFRLGRAIGISVLLLSALVFLGTWLLPKLLSRVLAWGSRELFLVSVVAIAVGVGYATQLAGLSFALGAFVAGLILRESEFSHQALSDVLPIRDIFGLLFFVTVGMLLDPNYALHHGTEIVSLVLFTFIAKSIIAGGVTRGFGYGNLVPWVTGFGLAQIGEFSFVLARTGLKEGALSKGTYDLLLSSTVLSMALSPLVTNLGPWLGHLWQKRRNRTDSSKPAEQFIEIPTGHAIVAGYGRSGRAAARALQKAQIPVIVVDLNHGLLGGLTAKGLANIWGDITAGEILKAARLDEARVLVLTIPDANTVHLAVQRARQLNPAIAIIARAVATHHVTALLKLGATSVIQPEFEGGVEMGRQALLQYRGEDADTVHLLSEVRSEVYGMG